MNSFCRNDTAKATQNMQFLLPKKPSFCCSFVVPGLRMVISVLRHRTQDPSHTRKNPSKASLKTKAKVDLLTFSIIELCYYVELLYGRFACTFACENAVQCARGLNAKLILYDSTAKYPEIAPKTKRCRHIMHI